MGIERDENGLLTIAVRTDLQGCKGRMLVWWFTFFEASAHEKAIKVGDIFGVVCSSIGFALRSCFLSSLYYGEHPDGGNRPLIMVK